MTQRWQGPSPEVIAEALKIVSEITNTDKILRLQREVQSLEWNNEFFQSTIINLNGRISELEKQLQEKESNDSTSNN